MTCFGEGNGNPLQCSCLENPVDRGAWWAAVHGVAQSRTRLKQLGITWYVSNKNVKRDKVSIISNNNKLLKLITMPFYRKKSWSWVLLSDSKILKSDNYLNDNPDCKSAKQRKSLIKKSNEIEHWWVLPLKWIGQRSPRVKKLLPFKQCFYFCSLLPLHF